MARSASARRRRSRAALITALIAVPMVVIVGIAVLVGAAVHVFAECRPDDATAGYTQEQLSNAETIVAAGQDLGLSVRDQTIGVMTAMGESSLRNLEYGDWERSGVTNPDGSPTTSIGLFQQQDGWGSREERLDPYTAATLFYHAMVERVPEPERSSLAPTLVAHRTQLNADPEHYARYWTPAARLVAALTGADTGVAEPGC